MKGTLTLTRKQIVERIRKKIADDYGTQQAYAAAMGLTPQAVSKILTGASLPINGKVLRSIGLRLARVEVEQLLVCETIAEPTEGVAA